MGENLERPRYFQFLSSWRALLLFIQMLLEDLEAVQAEINELENDTENDEDEEEDVDVSAQ